MQYFISHGDGAVHGPYSREQLIVYASQGYILRHTLVRSATEENWVQAVSMIDFGTAAPPPPPPPTPPIAQQIPHPVGTTTSTHDAAIRILVPVEVDPVAFIAGYLGLFSLIMFPAPVALGVGIWALARLKGRTNVRGAGRAWLAIVMGALGTVGLVIQMIAWLS
jgi:hypothetical protein